MFVIALLLAAAGSVIYHLSMKQVPEGINPFFLLLVSYGSAMLLCLLGMWWMPVGQRHLGALNWSSAGVALGIFGIEVGFLLAYRAGWNLGYAALSANVLTTMILLPIGYLLYREELSIGRITGLVFCCVGLWMLVRFK